jgi:uncharacterized tellurite resistance protein B-like protein
MLLRHWEDLLRLMSLMVIADGRVLEEEIRVFVFRMMELRRKLAPDLMFSEGLVRDWFAAHREEISEHTDAERTVYLMSALSGLDDFDRHKMLVESINAVARADGHRHDREMEIISTAAERWDIRVPRR